MKGRTTKPETHRGGRGKRRITREIFHVNTDPLADLDNKHPGRPNSWQEREAGRDPRSKGESTKQAGVGMSGPWAV